MDSHIFFFKLWKKDKSAVTFVVSRTASCFVVMVIQLTTKWSLQERRHSQCPALFLVCSDGSQDCWLICRSLWTLDRTIDATLAVPRTASSLVIIAVTVGCFVGEPSGATGGVRWDPREGWTLWTAGGTLQTHHSYLRATQGLCGEYWFCTDSTYSLSNVGREQTLVLSHRMQNTSEQANAKIFCNTFSFFGSVHTACRQHQSAVAYASYANWAFGQCPPPKKKKEKKFALFCRNWRSVTRGYRRRTTRWWRSCRQGNGCWANTSASPSSARYVMTSHSQQRKIKLSGERTDWKFWGMRTTSVFAAINRLLIANGVRQTQKVLFDYSYWMAGGSKHVNPQC